MALAVGSSAPAFTLTGVEGEVYSLSRSLSAGPVLLVFFKSGCGACDLAFPYINRLAAAYDDGWQLWAIAQEPPERARQYAERQDMKYPVLLDTQDYEVSKRYDPPATPTFFLIDPDGRVAYTNHGFSKDDLNEMSGLVAARLGVEAKEVAPAADGRPAFRPG